MTIGALGVARSHPDYMKLWYRANLERETARLKAHREARRLFLDAVKLTAGCADCGYRTHPAALEFDHISGDKVGNLGTMRSRSSWARLVAEIEKCEVVCANCHRVRTATRGGWGIDA